MPLTAGMPTIFKRPDLEAGIDQDASDTSDGGCNQLLLMNLSRLKRHAKSEMGSLHCPLTIRQLNAKVVDSDIVAWSASFHTLCTVVTSFSLGISW